MVASVQDKCHDSIYQDYNASGLWNSPFSLVPSGGLFALFLASSACENVNAQGAPG